MEARAMKYNDPNPYPAENPYNDGYTPEVGPEDPGGRWDDPLAGGGDGMVDTYYDSQGNPISTPERVTQAEHDRRFALRNKQANDAFNPNEGKPTGGSGGGGGSPKPSGPVPPYNPGYKFAPVPQFEGLPDFQGPTFKAPSFEDAMNDPGYKFAVDQGVKARDASAASRGSLRTGAQLRSLDEYGQNMGAQQYSNVYGRRFGEHVQDYGQKWGEYGQRYRQALDQYSPKYGEWTLGANAEIGAKNIANSNMWTDYFSKNLTAAQLMQLLSGL